MQRTSCILCQSSDLKILEENQTYPLYSQHTLQDISEDKVFDFTILGCSQCGCCQLRNLLDLSTLYNSSFTMTTFSKFLENHDTSFSKFILHHTNSKDFIEIGAVQCQLYKKLKAQRDLDYTVLDLFPYKNLPENVKFLQGNCEEFDFSSDKTLILSNVFEHLYNPHKFLEQVRKNKVQEIFISIPDFDSQLRSKNVNLINRQHIFYCGIHHINKIFSKYNYKCNAYLNNANQSCMFMFVFESDYYTLNFPLQDTVSSQVIRLFDEFKSKINKIDTSKSIFICPSGIYGQKLYIYMKDKQKHVVGFLDNDAGKHNSRLYGTDKLILSPSCLSSYNPETCLILLCESPYRQEILQSLQKYNVLVINI